MKGKFTMVMIVGIMVSLMSLGWTDSAQAASKKYKFRFSTAYPATAVDTQVWAKVMKEITERSDGAVTFETFLGGALGKMIEHLDMVGKRTVDLGETPLGAWPARLPLFGFEYAFPFGPSDPEIVTKCMYVMFSEFPEFDKQVKDNNAILIATLPWDSYMGTSREQIKSLKDLKGKKIGLWGIYFPKWVEAVGAVGVPRAMTEGYMMLKTGVLDISLEPVDVTWTHKHYEVAKHFFFLDSGAFTPKYLIMNLDAWKELTPELQKLFIEVGRKNSLEFAADLRENRRKIIDQLLKEKKILTTYALTAEERSRWAAEMPDLPAGWAKKMEEKGLPGWKALDRWMELTTGMGHKWPRAWGKR
jgi:TRAP-type C4-dicarboxylate transport system substrate-binding protein